MSVDGASVVRIFFQLTLPMSKSGLATVIIYSAMGAWNNFMFPLILTQSDSNRVLTLNLYQYQSQFGIASRYDGRGHPVRAADLGGVLHRTSLARRRHDGHGRQVSMVPGTP